MLNKLIYGHYTRGWSGFATLVLRVSLGLVFMMHGWQKITSFGIPGVTNMLDGIGFPLPGLFAYILAYGELGFGILMIAGFLTYIAAKFHVIVSFIALVTVHLTKGFFVNEGGFEFILLLLAASMVILVNGGGKYSLDAITFKKAD